MIKVSIADAKAKLRELIDRLEHGESIVINRDDAPSVEITLSNQFESPRPGERLASFIRRRREKLGLASETPPVPDDFDQPTHEDDWLDNPHDPLNQWLAER